MQRLPIFHRKIPIKKITGKLFVIIFSLAAIACFSFSIYIEVTGYHFRKNSIPVEAVIIDLKHNGEDRLGTPIVSYSLYGKTYTSKLNISFSSMHQGKHVPLYCNKDNYYDVRFLDDNSISAISSCMGSVFLIFVFLFVLLMRKRS